MSAAELVRRWESAAQPAPTVVDVGSVLADHYRARPLDNAVFACGHLQSDDEWLK